MRCKQCRKKLHRTHPFNSQFDLDICLNYDCPLYRRPQKYTANPENAKLFAPTKNEDYSHRFAKAYQKRNRPVVKAGVTQREVTDGRHYRFKK